MVPAALFNQGLQTMTENAERSQIWADTGNR